MILLNKIICMISSNMFNLYILLIRLKHILFKNVSKLLSSINLEATYSYKTHMFSDSFIKEYMFFENRILTSQFSEKVIHTYTYSILSKIIFLVLSNTILLAV